MSSVQTKLKVRRTLADIEQYFPPRHMYNIIMKNKGWDYKHHIETYQERDRALIAVLYLAALRISEGLRLKVYQFSTNEEFNRIEISGILLSKAKKKGQPRKHQYREAWLPLTGQRVVYTELIMKYIKNQDLQDDDLLFPFNRKRAWDIIKHLTGLWCHYFRALGEEYLYTHWKFDLLAVADMIKVDPKTLAQYIREGYKRQRSV
tara:strand:- start:2350 stop:2964 length:615 start_codon:yes stop_codon:yes gene_type:complete